jgi:hypothetical protein
MENPQCVQFKCSKKPLALSSTYVCCNFLYQCHSAVKVTSENCRMLHLCPLTVNAFQMPVQCGKSLSAPLLILQWLAGVAIQY